MENNNKICTCACHTKGMEVMHFMACCDYTYEKYIESDGTIDMELYKNLKEE